MVGIDRLVTNPYSLAKRQVTTVAERSESAGRRSFTYKAPSRICARHIGARAEALTTYGRLHLATARANNVSYGRHTYTYRHKRLYTIRARTHTARLGFSPRSCQIQLPRAQKLPCRRGKFPCSTPFCSLPTFRLASLSELLFILSSR